jgi:hypothetical protein
MKPSERIKSALLDPALDAGDLARLEQVTRIWQFAADAEKSEVDTENTGRLGKSENVRFWLPVLGSLVSTFALVGTLIFQIHQLTVNSRLQREANEGTELRDVLQTAAFPPELSAMASETRLKSMLSLPDYPQRSRDLAVLFLSATPEPVLFSFLFKEVVRTTDKDNLPDLVRLSYLLDTAYFRTSDRLKLLKTVPPPGPGSPHGSTQSGTLSFSPPFPSQGHRNAGISMLEMSPDQLQKTLDSLTTEMTEVGSAIADFLRKSPQDDLDLSSVAFYSDDLSGLDFGAANLTNADIEFSNLKGVDLQRVTAFEGSNWASEAWWRAAKINPALLDYLIANYGYAVDGTYYQDSTSPTEYVKEVSRLGGKLPSPFPAPSSAPSPAATSSRNPHADENFGEGLDKPITNRQARTWRSKVCRVQLAVLR